MERVEDRHIDFRIFKDVDSCETHYPAGAEILGPGKISGVMCVVKKGTVAIQIHGITVEQISDGSIFGEMGIVDPRPHSATIFAVTIGLAAGTFFHPGLGVKLNFHPEAIAASVPNPV